MQVVAKNPARFLIRFAKNNPHDQQVFENPRWPFETRIPAPAVALNSDRLVQRHVNSMLLSHFLCGEITETQTDRIKLDTQWFFDNTAGLSICEQFIYWLEKSVSTIDESIRFLVKGTSLSPVDPYLLRKNALLHIREFQNRWLEVFNYLTSEESGAKVGSAYKGRLKIELNRHCNEYLLRDLAARTFLPGYGFPTDVVNFDNFTIEDYKREKQDREKSKRDREDNISRYKGLPSRNLAIAIREYAPGAEIAIDGRVFRSAGVSLHWHNIATDVNEPQRLDMAWRCDSCGEMGYEEGISNRGALVCTNSSCLAPIKSENKFEVLRPAGFITDAYESTSNNIEGLKFIPVQPSWVFIKSPRISLPNPQMGTMAFGSNGRVFHHSSGEHGKGFALCMSCGRAESMCSDGNDSVYPKTLSPDVPHRAPRPTKEDRSSSDKFVACQGSRTLLKNIHLGAEAITDVFEIALRHPENGEYLKHDDQHRKIALTISLALRLALAEVLGISASELGYSIRPSKMPDGSSMTIIQLYDEISGGAGFASSAPLHIERLLRLTVQKLDCPHCEFGCNECLIDSQTRHDVDNIDRNAALTWLGKNFSNYVGLADEDKLSFDDAVYVPGDLETAVRRLINQGFKHFSFVTGGDISEWDMLSPTFRKSIQNYRINDALDIDLILNQKIDNPEVINDLKDLVALGVNLVSPVAGVKEYLVAQAFKEGQVVTLACRDAALLVPGRGWHQNSEALVMSRIETTIEIKNYGLPRFLNSAQSSKGIVDLTIFDELNGSFTEFGDRFVDLIVEHDSKIADAIKVGKIKRISYSDRYIQNPAAVTILGILLAGFKKGISADTDISVRTLFKYGKIQGRKVYEDWISLNDFEDFSKSWITAMLGFKVDFTIEESNRDIPHHRSLEIDFDDGNRLKIRLDQGVAYWQIRFGSSKDIWFNFGATVQDQLEVMAKSLQKASVRNSETKWATDVLIELIEVPQKTSIKSALVDFV